MNDFFEKYFSNYRDTLISFLDDPTNKHFLDETVSLLLETKKSRKKILLIGNGGSMAIAEHMAVDFTKNAKLCALSFSNISLLTAFSNDDNYEFVFQKMIESYGEKGDVLIAISSSGMSKNILNACEMAKSKKIKIITFSGFLEDNFLRKAGDVNFWINSRAYGYVEMIHHLILHYVNDAIIGASEYDNRGKPVNHEVTS